MTTRPVVLGLTAENGPLSVVRQTHLYDPFTKLSTLKHGICLE